MEANTGEQHSFGPNPAPKWGTKVLVRGQTHDEAASHLRNRDSPVEQAPSWHMVLRAGFSHCTTQGEQNPAQQLPLPLLFLVSPCRSEDEPDLFQEPPAWLTATSRVQGPWLSSRE